MDRLISFEPSNVVAIRIENGQRCCGELTLRNVMYTMPVAFRLHPVNKSRYTVKPQSGIITPLSTVTVEITYHLPPGAAFPDRFPYSDDSFLLHSVVVPGAAMKDSGSTLDSVPSDWFTAKKKQVFIDSGIRVMFLGSQVISRLVFEGNSVDEIRTVLERSDPSWRAVDSVDDLGRTLLHLAISLGRPDLVQLLLEFGPDIEGRSRSGCSPLEAAAASGETLIAELLLAHGASTERSHTSARGPIHLAVGGGHTEVLKLLLHKGADVNATTRDGNTALHIAAKEHRRDCARILISNGAQPDVRNTEDLETPLHIVARSGDEHMVRFLLHKGANKEIRNRYMKTAYDVAAEHGHVRLFDALKLGDRLCLAARKGDVRMIQRLIEGGAAVNGRDHHGWTPLHRAAFKGRTDAVRLLIEKGAESDSKDEDGYTALHCAAESGHADVIELLMKKGADTEARTNKGMTALQIAESLHYSGITRMLSSNVTGYKGGRNIQGYGPAHPRKGSGTQEARSHNIQKKHSRGRPIHSSLDRSTVPLAVL